MRDRDTRFWLLVLVAALAAVLEIVSCALGQCSGPWCPVVAPPHPAVVRVVNSTSTATCYASGTLIAADRILTCAHEFDRGVGRVTVQFPNGVNAEAELLGVDTTWDLGLLRIDPQPVNPVRVSSAAARPGESLQCYGYGYGTGRYRVITGRATGYVSPTSARSAELLEVTGAARDGDSGGPILNRAGELVGITMGTDGRVITGACCLRIRRFLEQFRAPLVPVPPPRPTPPNPAVGDRPPPNPSRTPAAPPDSSSGDERSDLLAELRAELAERFDGLSQRVKVQEAGIGNAEKAIAGIADRLEALRSRPDESGGEDVQVSGPETGPETPQDGRGGDRIASVDGWLITALPALLAALGWTGPPAIGVTAAAWLLRGVIRRRRKEASAKAEPSFREVGAIVRDGTEAAQLVRLSQLEGRVPLHDAIIGRFALDRLEEQVRSTGPEGDWARQFKTWLHDRFNEVAPPAVRL